ncbi:MAG: hypothetical protein LBQ98_06360 [Nitrososphaerota archaeon]|nr:hypothetical protein [Nitrososphaerota archaeon]
MDNSYDVPPTWSIDPYTGANVTHSGYRVENRTVELIIKNQPFVSTNIDGWDTDFYYNVRIKGHFSEDWLTLYTPTITPYYAQSNSENTIISFNIQIQESYLSVGPLSELPLNAKIDFQVQALIGYVHRIYNASATHLLDKYPWVFEGKTSAWSNTQTLPLTETLPTPTSNLQSPTPTPNSSGSTSTDDLALDWLQVITVVLLVAIVVSLVCVVAFLNKLHANGKHIKDSAL